MVLEHFVMFSHQKEWWLALLLYNVIMFDSFLLGLWNQICQSWQPQERKKHWPAFTLWKTEQSIVTETAIHRSGLGIKGLGVLFQISRSAVLENCQKARSIYLSVPQQTWIYKVRSISVFDEVLRVLERQKELLCCGNKASWCFRLQQRERRKAELLEALSRKLFKTKLFQE